LALSDNPPNPTRLIKIAIRDIHGQPAPAAGVEIAIDGRPSGSIFTGQGVTESTIGLDDRYAVVQLRVTVDGQTQVAVLAPDQDSIQFNFSTSVLFKAQVPPVARCPDGTTGSPCVTCRDGTDTWMICT